jgi:hypothetical protein
MEIQIIPAEELVPLTAQKKGKHQDCTATVRLQVSWHEEHEGCNWDVDILGDSNTEAKLCNRCIQGAVQAFRPQANAVKIG